MKRVCCLILLLALFALPARAAEYAEGYVRLHVVASSDTDADQRAKLVVRDAVRACAASLLEDCGSADEAYAALSDNVDQIERAAREAYDGEARAEIGVFDFPDRVYDGALVPAGAYRAVRVVLGAGAGRNWWCVLYPDLCLPGDGEEAYFGIWRVFEKWLMWGNGCA